MVGIVDAADSQLALASFSRDRFPAAAELRAVNWTEFISAESHGFLQFGVEGIDQGSLRRTPQDGRREHESTSKENPAQVAGVARLRKEIDGSTALATVPVEDGTMVR